MIDERNQPEGVKNLPEREERFPSRERLAKLKEKILEQHPPVLGRKDELTHAMYEAFGRKGIFLLQGEPGSGKTIFAPDCVQALVEHLELPDKIVMLEPRKDATSAAATAIAAVTDKELGREVGYSTSEAKAMMPNTRLGVITPGIFLRHLIEGRMTKDKVGAVILDEVHEGSADYHLIFGLLKLMHERGEAPPIVLMSATMDKEGLQSYFGIDDKDYLKVEGRTHPIKKRYEKPRSDEHGEHNYIRDVVWQTRTLCARKEEGDVLVFMPGAREIDQVIDQLKDDPSIVVLPLHGSLNFEDREEALYGKRPPGVRRRVIVSTNIAETSLTVPGIHFVVDSCRHKVKRFNVEKGMDEMPVEFISKAQAEQRAGRAGRLGPGEAVRVMSQEDFEALPEHPESEIRRTNLSHFLLRLAKLGIDPKVFPYKEPPEVEAIRAGVEELRVVGAVDAEGKITPIGEEMMELPFDPRNSRMVIEGRRRGCPETALVLAAHSRETNIFQHPTPKLLSSLPSNMPEDSKKREVRSRMRKHIVDTFMFLPDSRNGENRGQAYGVPRDYRAVNPRAYSDSYRESGGYYAPTEQEDHQKSERDHRSDQMLYLNIFQMAIREGVFEASRAAWDRSPTSREAARRFQAWCETNYLNAKGLTHIAARLTDYAESARIPLNRAELGKKLKEVSSYDVGCLMLSSHADMLLVDIGDIASRLPKYTRLGEKGNAVISPGSVAFEDPQPLCLATSFHTGSALQGLYTQMYASGIHPVVMDQLREVAPHAMRSFDRMSRRTSVNYDKRRAEIVQGVWYEYKGYSVGVMNEPVRGPEATQIFAEAIMHEDVLADVHLKNLRVVDRMKALARDQGIPFLSFELSDWYVERLGGRSSLRELKGHEQELVLTEEDVLPKAERESLPKQFPKEIVVGSHALSVTYNEGSRWERESERGKRAVIHVSFADIFELKGEEPTLGSPKSPLKIRWTVSVPSSASRTSIPVEASTLRELQEKVGRNYEYMQFEAWKPPVSALVSFRYDKPMPSLQDLKVVPLVYGKNARGESLFAYPAVVLVEHSGSGSGRAYVVRYTQTEEEAKALMKEAREIRARLEKTGSTVEEHAPSWVPRDPWLRESLRGRSSLVPEKVKKPEPVAKPLPDLEEARENLDEKRGEFRRVLELLQEQELGSNPHELRAYGRIQTNVPAWMAEIDEMAKLAPKQAKVKWEAFEKKVDAALQKSLEVVYTSYDPAWRKRYELLKGSIGQVIERSQEAQMYIKEGLTTREELETELRTRLDHSLRRLQQSDKSISLESWLRELVA